MTPGQRAAALAARRSTIKTIRDVLDEPIPTDLEAAQHRIGQLEEHIRQLFRLLPFTPGIDDQAGGGAQ